MSEFEFGGMKGDNPSEDAAAIAHAILLHMDHMVIRLDNIATAMDALEKEVRRIAFVLEVRACKK